MHFTLGKQMSNYCAPCFYRIDFVVIPSYIELPCWNQCYFLQEKWKDLSKFIRNTGKFVLYIIAAHKGGRNCRVRV